MATLHVRNVPEELYQRLQCRAAAQNRSITAETIALLEKALAEAEQDQGAILEEIRRRRQSRPVRSHTPDSVELIRQDRDR